MASINHLISLFCILVTIYAASGRLALSTYIACENKYAKLKCPKGSAISIVSAEYGRKDRSTCKSAAMHNTNCKSGKSKSATTSRCNGHKSCTIKASNSVFGDPCRGTYKYLQVHYICNPDASWRSHYEPPCGEERRNMILYDEEE